VTPRSEVGGQVGQDGQEQVRLNDRENIDHVWIDENPIRKRNRRGDLQLHIHFRIVDAFHDDMSYHCLAFDAFAGRTETERSSVGDRDDRVTLVRSRFERPHMRVNRRHVRKSMFVEVGKLCEDPEGIGFESLPRLYGCKASMVACASGSMPRMHLRWP